MKAYMFIIGIYWTLKSDSFPTRDILEWHQPDHEIFSRANKT